MPGIVAYGAYVPYWRLEREAITAVVGGYRSRGNRAVAGFDEDTTTMGLEAARAALRSTDDAAPSSVVLATTEPAYQQKNNANAIHAALDLDSGVAAFDTVGNVRAAAAAVLAADRLGGLVVASDMRNGPSGSSDESAGGDAAAALLFGDNRVVAEFAGAGHATHEFMERWRVPGEPSAHSGDERFLEHVYRRLLDGAIADAYKDADISDADVSHVIVSAASSRVGRLAARSFGRPEHQLARDFAAEIGYCGAAHWVLQLTDVLDRAEPDQFIAAVIVGDGVSVLVFRTTSHLASYRAARNDRGVPNVDELLAQREAVAYGRFLRWRGMLRTEEAWAADPQPYSLIAAERNTRWKYGLVGSRDDRGYIHLPPARVSSAGGSIDVMTPIRMADIPATVATLTVDNSANSPAPVFVNAVLDFDGGGRATVEVTDVGPDDLAIGDRVEMTFRRLSSSREGYNYFWKARPIRAARGY